MTPAIHLVADVKALLGEGPTWLPDESALLWVDIKGRRIFRLDAAGLREWATPMQVGSVAPRTGGGYIAGTNEGFFTVDMSDSEPRFTFLFNPEEHLPDNRFNDGKVDRAGRFWAGSMDDLEKQSTGALYRIDALDRWTKIDGGYGIANGPAFSPSGDIIYKTDTARQVIYQFDLAPDGSVGERRLFAQFGEGEGFPDGMTVDAEGCLWVAFWGGWAIRRFSSGGEMLTEIRVPVQQPTSLTFGGSDLDQLYMTSACIGIDPAALEAQPAAGGLFRIEAGIKGLAERPFAG